MNPYLVLQVPRTADDQAIRRAYLDAIKLATPESDPQRFKVLTAAYEQIRDQDRRLRLELGRQDGLGDSPMDVLLQMIEHTPRPGPLSYESMQEFLRLCSKA
jgi:curved DNA-binding protein CbpA